MISFPRRPLLVSSFVLLTSVSVFLGSAHAADEPDTSLVSSNAAHAPSRLVCQPCQMDFGKVRVGGSKALPIVLRNEGRTRITISSKDKQARWVSPRGLALPYTLMPGARVKFDIVYHPLDGHRVIGHIAYRSNAANHLLPISVKAEASSSGTLTAIPASLNFGNVPVGSTATLSQTIKNTGTTNVTLEQVAEAGTGFTAGNVTIPQLLAPGHSVTFNVKFEPQKAGSNAGSLITMSTASNSRLSVVENGTGTAGGSISISPSSLSFGNVAVGSSSKKTVTLTASGTAMTVKSDALSSSEYSVNGLTLPLKIAAGKSVTFQAVFSPQSSGAANGTLSLMVTSPSSTIKASMSGTGTKGAQHSVSLSWKPDSSSSIAGYNVYRSAKSTGPYGRLTSSVDTAPDYLDTSVATGSTYYYEVTAVNDQGLESARSAAVKATVP
jgi:Abnormal spindle-like microcephaly-assoc'd, ASPM-SPD-2-Hydin